MRILSHKWIETWMEKAIWLQTSGRQIDRSRKNTNKCEWSRITRKRTPKGVRPTLKLIRNWCDHWQMRDNNYDHQNMDRSLVRDDFKGRLKDPGGAKWSKWVAGIYRQRAEPIIKYYWSNKYLKGRDDKINYHSLPPLYGVGFKPIWSVASTGLRAALEPGHTGMSFCYPISDGMWRCHLG